MGATPPEVFSRWMNVVFVSLFPPVGPGSAPTTWSRSQGIAPGSTNVGSEEEAIIMAQMVLVSRECCQVARAIALSSGLGLRKWVMICLSSSLNNVACGPKNVQTKPEADGRQM